MPRPHKFWNIAKNENSEEADLMLYGTIGSDEFWDDISDKAFKEEITNLGDVKNINIYINSPGGSVFAAVAIANTLKNHSATVTAYIDGLAASAATIITSACDIVKMPKNALFMIHNPWTIAWGEKKDFEKTIDMLEKVKDSIVETYLSKTGLDKEQLSELMDNESWLNSEEAKSYGFIDEIVDLSVEKEIVSNKLIMNGMAFDVSKFKNFKGGEKTNEIDISIKNKESVKSTVKAIMKAISNKDKEEKMTAEEIKNKYPDIYDSIFNKGKGEGVSEERNRIQEIDNLEIVGHEELVKNAKYTEPSSASILAIKILNIQKEEKKNKLSNIYQESQDNVIETLANDGTDKNKPEEKVSGIGLGKILNFMNKKTKEEK